MKKKIIFYGLILFFLLAGILLVSTQGYSKAMPSLPRLLFFYSQNCHSCQKVKLEVMPDIEKEFFDKIIIEYLDTADVNNYKLMLSLKEKYKSYEDGVPAVFIEGVILVGYERIKDELKNTIQGVLEKGIREKSAKLPGIDLAKRFLSFGLLAIIAAGLVDGINPCAFTVIVFFISFLALQGYKKKELATIGLSFILAVFLTYVLIGLGIFRFLYSLSKFYLVTKIVYYLIAGFCFILAGLAVYDLWLFIKEKKTEGMFLQLPPLVKNRIHAIIGSRYRKTEEARTEVAPSGHFPKLIVSAFITGFLVSLLEAVCTGQLYLPTITFMLKNTSLRIRAFGYLLLYNLMFVIPLFIVLLFALLGTASAGFSKFIRKHMITVKLLMAILFFGLGILILLGA